MSSPIFKENFSNLMSFHDYCESENIKPVSTQFGTNKTFDNQFIRYKNGECFTSFIDERNIFNISFKNNILEFSVTPLDSVNFIKFRYKDVLENKIKKENSMYIITRFKYILFVLERMINVNKYNINEIYFPSTPCELGLMYSILHHNITFTQALKDMGFQHTPDTNFLYKRVNSYKLYNLKT